jgi:lysophospholipase L1-like esterase
MCRFFKIFIVIFLTLSILGIAGEIYLRNFSFYGIEYFIQLDEKRIEKDTEDELNFISRHALDDLIKAEKDSLRESTQAVSNTYRIFILGDSIAAGGQLPQGKLRFAESMKDILQRNYPNVNFDILVCASGGWSTTQEVIAYEKYGKNIRHNLVIVAYCQNDDAESYQQIRKKDGRLILAFYKTGVPYISLVPFNQFFTERLLIVRFINERLIRLLQRYQLSFHINYCLIRDDKIYHAFRKLYTLTKSEEIPVVVVVFPHLVEEMDMHDARMSSSIQKWCKELGWGYVDLQKLYKSYGLSALRVNSDDPIHPNSLGHRIAAEAIIEKLKQMAVLNGSS